MTLFHARGLAGRHRLLLPRHAHPALGVARSYCYESPKPAEFGTAGSYWEAIGWKIDVSFRELTNRIHPKSHIGELRGLLPEKYSPFRANVRTVERACRVTKVDRLEHLVASHTKLWRDSTNEEQRPDGENGLLLTPTK